MSNHASAQRALPSKMAVLALSMLAIGCAHGRARGEPPAFCAAEVHRSSEQAHGVHGALAALNRAFLAEHAAARQQRCRWLAHEALVLRYDTGVLEARFRGRALGPQRSILPAAYHPLKDITHALFLATLVASRPDAAAHRPAAARAIEAVQQELRTPGSPTLQALAGEDLARQARLLAHAQAVLASSDSATLEKALAAARPDLAQNLDRVASETLRALHASVQAIRAEVDRVDPAAWRTVVVVIAVVHQARADALEVQYFERLLREHATEGARAEHRLILAENLESPAAQVGLIATHVVDEQGAALIFGDPARLQRDVLATHATKELDELFSGTNASRRPADAPE